MLYGYTQFEILSSVERINITNNILTNKWENVNISNECNLNLKFYGSGIFNIRDEIFIFIGGKIGFENDDEDYKKEIYNFNFNYLKFYDRELCFNEQLYFIENQFHYCDNDIFGNFPIFEDGCLCTLNVFYLKE